MTLAFHRPAPTARELAAAEAPIPLGVDVHPAANLFPMMPRDELEKLAEDILAHGQQEPCVMHRGKLLDGRNRWAACQLKGITPRTREWEGGTSPTSYVMSLNLHRRHLRPEQRAALAVQLKPIFEAEALERMRRGAATPGVDSTPGPKARNEGGRAILAAAAAAAAGQSAAKKLDTAARREPSVLGLAAAGKASVERLAAVAALPPAPRKAAVERLQRGEKPAAPAKRGGAGAPKGGTISINWNQVETVLKKLPAAPKGRQKGASDEEVAALETQKGALMDEVASRILAQLDVDRLPRAQREQVEEWRRLCAVYLSR